MQVDIPPMFDLFYIPFRTCVEKARATPTSTPTTTTTTTTTTMITMTMTMSRRARDLQKGLSAREIACRGRRPRRSSHPLRREPSPRERCWTVHASTSSRRNVPPRARLVTRRPLLLLLALSPDDSALAARAHICMRVLVSFSVSVLSLSFFLVVALFIYLALSLLRFSQSHSRFCPSSSVSLYLTARKRHIYTLPFSLSFVRVNCTNMFVYTKCIPRRTTNNDDDTTTDGKRARARCPLSLCLNSRARVCVLD